jgi:hypothetical protein
VEFPPIGCPDPVVINAVLTTQMETGSFFDTTTDMAFTGTEPVVTNVAGTLDGLSMSLIAAPMFDWLNGSQPEGICFAAGGTNYCLNTDFGNYYLTTNATGEIEYLNWSAIDPASPVPEPSTIMLLTALLLLGLMRWAQMNLRKLSVHLRMERPQTP